MCSDDCTMNSPPKESECDSDVGVLLDFVQSAVSRLQDRNQGSAVAATRD